MVAIAPQAPARTHVAEATKLAQPPEAASAGVVDSFKQAFSAKGTTSTWVHKLVAGGVGVATAALLTEVGFGMAGLPGVSGKLLGAGVALASGAAGYTLAEFGSGVFHFVVDNYEMGDVSTRFQQHHFHQRDITRWGIANTIYSVSRVALPVMAATAVAAPFLLGGLPLVAVGSGTAAALGMTCLSQAAHRWSHMKEEEVPKPVRLAQKAHLLIDQDNHVVGHHHRPWEENYCIVNGMLNYPLRKIGLWRWAEKVIYNATGVQPHSWENEAIKARALGMHNRGPFHWIEKGIYAVYGRKIPAGAPPPPPMPPTHDIS